MKPFEIIATSAFGIESVTARELTTLGYEDIMTENGRVTFRGDFADIAKANVELRTADRVLIKLAEFRATTFEELFQGVYAVEWADILSPDAFIHVVGKSVKSTLFSVPDCQSISRSFCRKRYAESNYRKTEAPLQERNFSRRRSGIQNLRCHIERCCDNYA